MLSWLDRADVLAVSRSSQKDSLTRNDPLPFWPKSACSGRILGEGRGTWIGSTRDVEASSVPVTATVWSSWGWRPLLVPQVRDVQEAGG